ncbi:MAG: hypothetical protein LBN29_05905 [Mediterranea sp.]|jgi:hypothetical protein|nr:hypothetical protein [Mediterranea sp.]
MRKNLKRNVLGIVCLFIALLVWNSCDSDMPKQEEVSPPDSADMVKIRVEVTSDTYKDGSSPTRAGQTPEQFIQPVGEDLVLVSELTATPINRAATTRALLPTGTKILMIVFKGNQQDSIPIGIQALEVGDDGSLTISLPNSDTPYSLVLYSENSAETQFDPADFVSGTLTAQGDDGYQRIDGGALVRTPIPTTGAEGSAIPADMLYALIPNIDSRAKIASVTLRHAFAELDWTLMVNPNSALEESIGAVDAGFYPRYQDATPNLGKMALIADPGDIAPQTIWSGSDLAADNTEPGSFFTYTHPAGDEPEHTYTATVRFIPAHSPATLFISKLTFNTNKGEPATLTNDPYPIKSTSTGEPITFQPGMKYTVTSKLTKKDYFLSKRVLAIAQRTHPERVGAAGAAELFLKSAANFSLTGTVPVNGLTIDASVTASSNGNLSRNLALRDSLASDTPPDIIIAAACGWDSIVSASNFTVKPILDYIDNGGVMIIFFENTDLTYNSVKAGFAKATDGKLLLGGVLGESGMSYAMNAPANDPILTGKNGNVTYNFNPDPSGTASLAGKYWGESNERAEYFDIAPGAENDFVIYSSHDGHTTMVRYKHKNLLFVGDYGFIDSPDESIDPSTTAHPFAIDFTAVDAKGRKTYRPASKNYSTASGDRHLVDNSHIFGNIMAWAIYQAEHHGINKRNQE